MLDRAHHIDFVVRDLDAAVSHWSRLLGRRPYRREALPDRGIELARYDVGGLWVILVQPVDPSSPVMDHLDTHGEGFFHLAFAVEDLDTEVARFAREGFTGASGAVRRGVEGWRLIDIPAANNFGAMLQLVEEDEESHG